MLLRHMHLQVPFHNEGFVTYVAFVRFHAGMYAPHMHSDTRLRRKECLAKFAFIWFRIVVPNFVHGIRAAVDERLTANLTHVQWNLI